HEDLGSMRKKADRVKKLAGQICAQIQGADKDAVCAIAAHVYSDLTSEAVREFPQLQGYMGGEYARHAKKPEIVCSGIKEFYYPLSAKSPLPGGLESAIVSLAGKIDTIIGDFAVGLIPSGSEDPHGLRRQALGAVRILLEKSIPLSLSKIAQESMELVKADVPGLDVNAEKICASALEFIWARAESIFEEKGFSFDEVRAVREVALVRQVPETLERISALHNARKDENFKSLTISFKRVANILRQAGFNAEQTSFNEELIRDDAERGLYAGFNVAKEKIEHYLAFNAGRIAQENFESAFKEMIALKPFVDKFFDEVMVMAEDPAIKNNRLSLLANLHKTFKLAADLSQLQ
ncbi:MAG: glycine--tRNA ligase subunit beta, partial [Elusimicrobia bacterium]|nr:glycine--tRNA ligase subunit beta [Elusimicrobiota bacterium]